MIKLTPRQREVMDLVVQGYSPSGIMEKLFITKGCVNTHMINIYRTMGIHKEKGKDIKILAMQRYLNEQYIDLKQYTNLANQYNSLLKQYNKLLEETRLTS